MSVAESDLKCRAVQKLVFQKYQGGREVNVRQVSQEAVRTDLPDGIVQIRDIRYAGTYPNSYLDLWYPSKDSADGLEGPLPIVVYFHGGGFLFGDKTDGDPIGHSGQILSVLTQFLLAHYIVASVNYALAPEYRFPVPLLQADEAFGYLIRHADTCHINPQRMAMMGSSAGAILSAMYGLVAADPDYAAKFGLKKAAATPDNLKVLGLDETAFNYHYFQDSPEMIAMAECTLGTPVNDGEEKARLYNVTDNIKSRYLPAVLTASNQEHWFYEDAKALHDKIDAIGVDNKFFYRDASVERLEHGYMSRFATDAVAREALDTFLSFMGRYLKQ